MHLSWISIIADAAILLAGGLAARYSCLGTRPGHAAQVHREDLLLIYPDLDRELETIWRRGEH